MTKTEEIIWNIILKYRADYDAGLSPYKAPVGPEIIWHLKEKGIRITNQRVNQYIQSLEKKGLLKRGKGHRDLEINGKE